MDQQKPERVLRLLKYLKSNLTLPIEELAAKLETSRRTLYRYIDTFKAAGFNVIRLHGTIYKIEEEDERRRPEPTPQLPKFQHSFADLRKYVENHPHHVETTKVNMLKRAIRDERKVTLKNYRSSTRNRIRDRIIEPYDFTADFGRVWAYDLYEGRNILFKISRISKVQIREDKWTESARHRRQRVDIFGHISHNSAEIRARLTLKAANCLKELLPTSAEDMKREGKQWYLQTSLCDFEGFCVFFAGMLDQVEILYPDKMKDYLQKFIQTHYGKYFQTQPAQPAPKPRKKPARKPAQ